MVIRFRSYESTLLFPGGNTKKSVESSTHITQINVWENRHGYLLHIYIYIYTLTWALSCNIVEFWDVIFYKFKDVFGTLCFPCFHAYKWNGVYYHQNKLAVGCSHSAIRCILWNYIQYKYFFRKTFRCQAINSFSGSTGYYW